MKKTEIDSILLVNLYFTVCKLNKPQSQITELVRKYLSKKVDKALIERKSTTRTLLPSRVIMMSLIILYILN